MFAWLAAVARAPGVSHFAVRVAVVLSGYFSRGRREAWPKQTTLAEALGAHPDGVRKALLQLRDAGLLELRIGQGRGRLNVYVMIEVAPETPTAVGAETPTASGVSEPESPTVVGVSDEKTPTAVCRKPRQPGRHGTSKGEPVNPSLEKRERASRRSPETELPSDFPTVDLIEQAQATLNEAGLHHVSAERMGTNFRDHHTAKGSRFRRWPAAWAKWTRNEIDWAPNRQASAAPQRPRSRLAIELETLRGGGR